MKLVGFTILKDGVRFDYPFVESLKSLGGICEKVYVALGKNDDGTEAIVRTLPFVKIIPTVWDDALRKGGQIFSQQTNIALSAARDENPGAWGICLQCDEVVNDRDYSQILADLKKAEDQGCDAVSFRFLHFWQGFDRIAVGPRWFPHEIRAMKLTPEIKSIGDSQGFGGSNKTLDSDVQIFHYSHARKGKVYEEKKRHFHRWWNPDEAIEKKMKEGAKKDPHEKTIRYLGPHPQAMKDRVGEANIHPADEVFLVGDPQKFTPEFTKRIKAKQIHWARKVREFKSSDPNRVIVLEGSFLDRLRYGSKVPHSLASERARPWPEEFVALLKLSERGIGVE